MSSSEHDDLTLIKFIGPETAAALAGELDVDTFADLAELSVDQISRALADAGLSRQPSGRVESWIQESVQRTAALETSADAAGTASTPTTAAHDWRTEAEFVVEFQSRDIVQQVVEQEHQIMVHEIETDVGKPFAVGDGALAFDWMRRQLETARHAEEVSAEEVVAAVPGHAVASAAVGASALSVTYIEIEQPPYVARATVDQAPENRNLGAVRTYVPLQFRVGFTIGEEQLDALVGSGVEYTTEVFVQAWGGDTVRIEPTDPGRLTSGTSDYVVSLRHSFDAAGLYRVRIVVSLATEIPVADFFEAPMLQAY